MTKDDECKENKEYSCKYIYLIFHMLMTMIAVYLSYRCNKGFDFSGFIAALIFPYIYIIYTFSSKGTCGIFEKE